jgi:hypothetical protein
MEQDRTSPVLLHHHELARQALDQPRGHRQSHRQHKTRSGLTVRSEIDTNSYPKGLVVSDTDFDAIRLIRDEFHGDWNYAIEPLNNESIVS